MRDATFEQLLVTWLGEGPVRPPDAPVEAAVAHARAHAPRPKRPAWWRFPMGTTQGLTPVPVPRPALAWTWIVVAALVTVALVGLLLASGGFGPPAPSLLPETVPAVVPPVASPSPTAEPTGSPSPEPAATADPTTTPDWSAPPVGRIAVVRDGDIWVVEPGSGQAARNLTATADVREAAAAWSPDGARLAYLVEGPDYMDGQIGSTHVYALWVVGANGDGARQLFPAQDPGGAPLRAHLDLSWSPDGRVVGWTRYVGMALTGASLVGVDGGFRDFPATVTWHVTKSGFQNPVISPDGSRVAFSTSVGYRTAGAPGVSLASTDLAGADTPVLLDATLGLGDVTGESIAWLDASSLVFVADHGVWQIAADGTNLVRLTPENLRVEHALPSPDGSAIAFIAGTRVYVMSTGGTLTVRGNFPASVFDVIDRVCDLPGTRARSLAWSPDGRHVAFAAAVEGGCALAWVSAKPALTAGERWGTPDFFDPTVWDEHWQVAATVTGERVDAAPISWGP